MKYKHVSFFMIFQTLFAHVWGSINQVVRNAPESYLLVEFITTVSVILSTEYLQNFQSFHTLIR